MDQDVGILELGHHLLGISDEVGREIAAVELHALDHVELGLGGLGLLDRDHALVADLLHGLRDHLANGLVTVRRDRADLGDFLGRLNLLRPRLDILDDLGDREIDAALEVHGVHAGRDRLGALAHDRLGEHRRGGGAVTRDVTRLARDLADHLGAHVLELVGELDLFRDRHAVLGDTGRPEALLDHHVAALRPERDLHGIGENVHAAQHLLAGVSRKLDFLGCHWIHLQH